MPGQIRKVSAPTYDDYDIEDDDPELIALKQKKALARKKQKQKEQQKKTLKLVQNLHLLS